MGLCACTASPRIPGAQITCQRPVCLQVFSEYKQLGRFTLRESGNSVAAGNVMRLLSREELKKMKAIFS